ncbi:hypothetical protein [Pseudothioclava nitratireducens]|uniref:hypothetical protein n=1 Tax=Pseudothioclava nitratireducens TaxID=1928646 RepID=UPI0023DB5A56|nr:hypothetical protein [Defluviimonas nitratireducens]MDF1619597.1 hypothetical protein [Defluviimonas nitratireducens]
MSAQTHTTQSESGLMLYVIAAVVVLGAVAGLLTMGLGGMILWMVGVTFACLGMLVALSII